MGQWPRIGKHIELNIQVQTDRSNDDLAEPQTHNSPLLLIKVPEANFFVKNLFFKPSIGEVGLCIHVLNISERKVDRYAY